MRLFRGEFESDGFGLRSVRGEEELGHIALRQNTFHNHATTGAKELVTYRLSRCQLPFARTDADLLPQNELSDRAFELPYSTNPNTTVERLATRVEQLRAPATLLFHGGFYGALIFCCKTAQFCVTPRESVCGRPALKNRLRNSAKSCAKTR